jgi:anti-sigma B factor antagonist
MKFSKTYDDARGMWKVSLGGEVDASYAEEMKNNLTNMINEKPTDILLDCAQLTYLDSSGLGALVNVLKQVKEEGHSVTIVNLKPHIAKIFTITKLDTLFSIEVK